MKREESEKLLVMLANIKQELFDIEKQIKESSEGEDKVEILYNDFIERYDSSISNLTNEEKMKCIIIDEQFIHETIKYKFDIYGRQCSNVLCNTYIIQSIIIELYNIAKKRKPIDTLYRFGFVTMRIILNDKGKKDIEYEILNDIQYNKEELSKNLNKYFKFK